MRNYKIAALLVAALCSCNGYAQSPAAQTAGEPDRLELFNQQMIRCAPTGAGWDVPCFRFDANVVDARGVPTALPQIAREQIKVLQTAPTAGELKVLWTSLAGSQSKLSVLVLFDVSGSMKDPTAATLSKFEAAREAASKILDLLKSGQNRVAIVPFDSQHVRDRFAEARFVDDFNTASAQLTNLPAPANGNTALYSATLEGLDFIKRSGAGGENVLIVMTDGKNDVGHPDFDDPDLETDIAKVVKRIREDQIAVFTIGFGEGKSIDEDAMRSIASEPSNFTVATNLDTLRKRFEGLTITLVNKFRVTATTLDAQSFAELPRLGNRKFKLHLDRSGKALESAEVTRTFNATVPPSPQLAGEKEEVAAYEKFLKDRGSPAPAAAPTSSILTFVFFALLIAMLWFVLPRLIWRADNSDSGFSN